MVHAQVETITATKPKVRDDSLRFANALADAVQLALLLDEAVWELQQRQSARKAIVAAWFALSLLPYGTATATLGGSQRSALLSSDVFYPVIRQESVAPAQAQGIVAFLLAPQPKL